MATAILETPADVETMAHHEVLAQTETVVPLSPTPPPVNAQHDVEHSSISSGSSTSSTSERPSMRNSTTQTLQDGATDDKKPRKLKAKRPSFRLFTNDKEKSDNKEKSDDKKKKLKTITGILRKDKKEKSQSHNRSSSSNEIGDEQTKKEKRKSILEILGLSDYEGEESSPTKMPRALGSDLDVLGFSDDERNPNVNSNKRRHRLSLNLSDLLGFSDPDSADEERGGNGGSSDQTDKRRKRLSMNISDMFQRRRGQLSPRDALYPQRATTPGPYGPTDAAHDAQHQRPELSRSLSLNEPPYGRRRSETNSTDHSSPGVDGNLDVSTPATSVDDPFTGETEHQQEARRASNSSGKSAAGSAVDDGEHPKRSQKSSFPLSITTRFTRSSRSTPSTPSTPIRNILSEEPVFQSPVSYHITPPFSPQASIPTSSDETRKQSSLRYSVKVPSVIEEKRDDSQPTSVAPTIESIMLRQLELSERLEESMRRLETRVNGQREEIDEMLTSRYEETIRRLEEKVNRQSNEIDGLREVVGELYSGQPPLLEPGHTRLYENQNLRTVNEQQLVPSTGSSYTLVNSLVVKPIRETVSSSYEMGKNVLHTLYVRPVIVIWNTVKGSNNE